MILEDGSGNVGEWDERRVLLEYQSQTAYTVHLLCPIAKVGCDYSFPPFCVFHRLQLAEVKECWRSRRTTPRLYSYLLTLLNDAELEFESDRLVRERTSWFEDYLGEAVVREMQLRGMKLPPSILEKLKKLEEKKNEKRDAATVRGSETRKEQKRQREEEEDRII